MIPSRVVRGTGLDCRVDQPEGSLEGLDVAHDEIHVWLAHLDGPTSRVRTLVQTLSPDERARAARFHLARLRDRFVVARGLLRVTLGRYLRMPPGQVRFSYGPYGKPALDEECNPCSLRFSVSHSDSLVLYAVARGREVGIDLERIRAEVAWREIAVRFFSPLEHEVLRTLSAPLAREAFFIGWVRKEAYVKAKGTGFAAGLDEFVVSLDPKEPAALLSTKWDPEEPARWSFFTLTPGPGYVAALAAERCRCSLKCWQMLDAWSLR